MTNIKDFIDKRVRSLEGQIDIYYCAGGKIQLIVYTKVESKINFGIDRVSWEYSVVNEKNIY